MLRQRHRNAFVAVCYLSLFVYIKLPSSEPVNQNKTNLSEHTGLIEQINFIPEIKLSRFKTPKRWPSDSDTVSSSKEEAVLEGLPEAELLPNLPIVDAILKIKPGNTKTTENVDIEQWIEYAWFAGIDKIYVYDSSESNKFEQFVSRFYPEKVIYEKWDKNSNSNKILDKWDDVNEMDQVWAKHGNVRKSSLKNIVYNNQQKYWILESNINEFVFSSVDKKSGFLRRIFEREWLLFRSCESFSVKRFEYFVDKKGEDNEFIDHPFKAHGIRAREVGDYGIRLAGRVSGKMVTSYDLPSTTLRVNFYSWNRMDRLGLKKMVKDDGILECFQNMREMNLTRF